MASAPAIVEDASEVTGPYDYSEIERYWHDPAYRAQCDAERLVRQQQVHALIDASMERARLRRAAERGAS
jgi:hypothetical protein